MRRWIAGAAMIMPLLGVVSAHAQTDPPSSQLSLASIYDLPSIVLVVNDEGGWLRGKDGSVHGPYEMSYIGTGFFISSDGYIVTAAHVAAPTTSDIKTDLVDSYIDDQYNCDPTAAPDECAAIEALHQNAVMHTMTAFKTSEHLSVLTQDQPGTSDGIPAILAASSQPDSHDVAVLKVKGQDEPVSILGSDSSVSVGDEVATLGYPASTEDSDYGYNVIPTITTGHVLSHLHGNSSSPAAQHADLLEIDAAIERGNSGGPGIGDGGLVDGIVSFGDIDSNDNYLVSADDVKAVVAKTPANNRLGPIDLLYRLALAARTAGNTKLADRFFDECAAMNPVQVYCADHDQAPSMLHAVTLKSANNAGLFAANALRRDSIQSPPADESLSLALAAFVIAALLFRLRPREKRRDF